MVGKKGNRFDLRKDGPDTYEIYSVETGRTVSVGGKPRARLKLDEADVLVDMLNSGDQEADEETVQ